MHYSDHLLQQAPTDCHHSFTGEVFGALYIQVRQRRFGGFQSQTPASKPVPTLAALLPVPQPSLQTLQGCIRCLLFPQQPPRNPSKEVTQLSPTQDEPAEKSDTSPSHVTYSSSIRRTSPRTVSFRVRGKASGRKIPIQAVEDGDGEGLLWSPGYVGRACSQKSAQNPPLIWALRFCFSLSSAFLPHGCDDEHAHVHTLCDGMETCVK